jgi:hypothetical protein
VVSWVSGESVRLQEIFVGLIDVHQPGKTGKEVDFRKTLSTNHVI